MSDKQILELALKALSEVTDELIEQCVDSDGKPKAPDMRMIMKVRGCLPPYCIHAFGKKYEVDTDE